MNIKERILETLEKGYLMSLGTVDDGGAWVADVIYVHDSEGTLYWMSDPDVRHSKAIHGNGSAACTITVTTKPGEDELGLQISGRAEKIEGPRHDLTVKHFLKRGHPAPQGADDVLEGDSWYMLKPSLIELIDKKNFGYEKKSLKL